ncbi:MAG: InlB B-repeat-containing protein [Bacilli bacterium]|nr:InlB B-repeat-containing protein [Bacilli bacterium]
MRRNKLLILGAAFTLAITPLVVGCAEVASAMAFKDVKKEASNSDTGTFTCAISSKNTLSNTGSIPTNTTASIVETYGTSKQMTSGNSQTLTVDLPQYYYISGLTLSMRSNGGGGAGSLTIKDKDSNPEVSYSIISEKAFNTASWNGAWSTTYVDIEIADDAGDFADVINDKLNHFEIKIEATANSLYCESYTIEWGYYDPALDNSTYYDVTFNPLNGSDSFTRSVVEGGSLSILPQNPTKEKDTQNQIRFVFYKWYILDASDNPANPSFVNATEFTTSTIINSAISVYAKYTEINYYILSFNTDGGTAVDSQEVDSGSFATKPSDSLKGGYRFAGWFNGEGEKFNFETTAINSNTTIYAHWDDISIKVNGVFYKVTSTEDVVSGNYLFVYEEGNVAFNGALNTLDAARNTVNVEFDQNNNIIKTNQTTSAYFTYDSDTNSFKSASGYYLGRTTNSNGMNSSTSTVYTNSVDFDDSGNLILTSSEGPTLRYNKASGDLRFRYYTANQQAIQLYRFGQYFTVTFNTGGGSLIDPVTALEGKTIDVPEAPTKDSTVTTRYSFAGWYTDAEFQNEFSFSSKISSNLTLYAKWDEITISMADQFMENEMNSSLYYSYKYSTSPATDNLTLTTLGVSGKSYANFEDVQDFSKATYAGRCAGGNNSIQLNHTDGDKGLITTANSSDIKKITVSWNENTLDDGTLNIYGSNTAYTAVSELYDENTQGALLGTIVKGTTTELEISGNYKYIGLRSNSGALYINSIVLEWDSEIYDYDVTKAGIRFGTSITKELWNGIVNQNPITRFGLFVAKQSELAGNTFSGKSLNSLQELDSFNDYYKDITNEYANPPVLNESTYSWTAITALDNLEEAGLKTKYVAVSYIVVNGNYVFSQELTKSLAEIAYDGIQAGTYSEDVADGSLAWLASLK